MIKVSVVVPVYNASNYIKKCLYSILNQTLREIEVIAIDDGSTDDSLKILNEIASKDSRLKVFTQTNKFAGVARNLGIRLSKGKYICFLDADDFFEKNMLSLMYQKAINECSDLVICQYYFYDSVKSLDNGSAGLRYINKQNSPVKVATLKDKLFKITNPAPWNKLFRLDLIRKYNVQFDPIKSANDFSFTYTMMSLCKSLSFINIPLIHYRINHSNNITSTRSKNLDSIIFAVKSLKNNLIRCEKFDEFCDTFYNRVFISLEYESSLMERSTRYEFFYLLLRDLDCQIIKNAVISLIIRNKSKRWPISLLKIRYYVAYKIFHLFSSEIRRS